jgi:2-polyprenyl-3-methyl-5-hydroxy-6-metoxy-1,4-benzoquinol methylase
MFHVEPSSINNTLLPNCPLCKSPAPGHLFTVKDLFLTRQEFGVRKCNVCEVAVTAPQPAQTDIGDYYRSDEYISHSNVRKGLINKMYHVIRSISLKNKYKLIAKHKRKGKLLDIGCGTGYFPNFMQHTGWDVTGIEPDKSARSFAQSHFGLTVYPEDELNQLPNAQFDLITMWHVLEHVYQPHQRLVAVHNLLKKDGIAVIAVPNHDAWDAKHYGPFWAAWDVPRHLYHFNKKSLLFIAEKVGFQCLNIHPMPFDAFYVSMLSEKYRTGRKNLPIAFFKGLISNMKALKTGNSSSLIFILKKA